MKKTLLVIGDLTVDGTRRAPNINRFLTEADSRLTKNFRIRMVTYEDLLIGELPEIEDEPILVALFFPFHYWNEHIEVYDKDSRIYGDDTFGREFERLFLRVERLLYKRYRRNKIRFINYPKTCALDRDKKATLRLLQSKKIPVPREFNVRGLRDLRELLDKGISLYIKPRFGAMGKGISYLSEKGLYSNFIYRSGEVISRHYDYNWQFHKIAGEDKFLKILIKEDMVWEEEIATPQYKRRKFDLRVYVIFGKVPYLYAKSAPVDKFVTNWSQGGRIEKKGFLKKCVPPEKVRLAMELAIKTARAMRLNFAGIDVIFSRAFEHAYVLEAHSFPAYESGFNLMGYLVDEIKRRQRSIF